MDGARDLQIVVAAALRDHAGAVLVQQRPPGKSMAGLWEFPGGKVEVGETPEYALARELTEELGIVVSMSDLSPIAFASEELADKHLILLLYNCVRWVGEPEARHATALQWRAPHDLHDLAMPPADGPLVSALERLA